jgi:HK97 gp10 family phage protein
MVVDNLMPNWSVKIISDTITPKLAAFAGKIEKELETELDPVGADMEDIARSLVRVRTGYLQSTIYYRVSGMVLEFGATADYASYNEFGTWRMAPQPFIRPALDANQQKILDAVLTGTMNALGL